MCIWKKWSYGISKLLSNLVQADMLDSLFNVFVGKVYDI